MGLLVVVGIAAVLVTPTPTPAPATAYPAPSVSTTVYPTPSTTPTPAPPAPPAQKLAKTGQDPASWALAAGVLAAGVGATTAAWSVRRRRADP